MMVTAAVRLFFVLILLSTPIVAETSPTPSDNRPKLSLCRFLLLSSALQIGVGLGALGWNKWRDLNYARINRSGIPRGFTIDAPAVKRLENLFAQVARNTPEWRSFLQDVAYWDPNPTVRKRASQILSTMPDSQVYDWATIYPLMDELLGQSSVMKPFSPSDPKAVKLLALQRALEQGLTPGDLERLRFISRHDPDVKDAAKHILEVPNVFRPLAGSGLGESEWYRRSFDLVPPENQSLIAELFNLAIYGEGRLHEHALAALRKVPFRDLLTLGEEQKKFLAFELYVAMAYEGRIKTIARQLGDELSNGNSERRLILALNIVSSSHLEGAFLVPKIGYLLSNPSPEVRRLAAEYIKYVKDRSPRPDDRTIVNNN